MKKSPIAEILQRRTSVRDFTHKPVEKELLQNIVRDAQGAPSWTNSQPVKVYIATGNTLELIRRDHAAASKQQLSAQPDVPVHSRDAEAWGKFAYDNMMNWIADARQSSYHDMLLTAGRQLWQAPAMVYITIADVQPVRSIFDAGLFTELLMISAAAYGVDSMIAYENSKYTQIIRAHMPIPEHESILIGVALGYRSDSIINTHRSKRVELDKILTIQE